MLSCLKTLIRLVCLPVAASLTCGVVSAQDLKRIRVSIIPIIDVAPMMAASKQGFFAKEGLQIDTSPTTGGAVGIPALIGGAVDIAFGNVVSTMLAASQGLDVRVLAPSTNMTDGPTASVLIGRKGRQLQGRG